MKRKTERKKGREKERGWKWQKRDSRWQRLAKCASAVTLLFLETKSVCCLLFWKLRKMWSCLAVSPLPSLSLLPHWSKSVFKTEKTSFAWIFLENLNFPSWIKYTTYSHPFIFFFYPHIKPKIFFYFIIVRKQILGHNHASKILHNLLFHFSWVCIPDLNQLATRAWLAWLGQLTVLSWVKAEVVPYYARELI